MSEVLEQVKKINSVARCIVDKEKIDKEMDRLAREVHRDLADSNPIVLCVMLGSLVPTADLIKRLDFPLQVDYLHATRYQGETSGESLKWLMEPRLSLKGRHILIVEDILDKGLTLKGVLEYCESKQPASIKTLAFVDKQTRRAPGALKKADYVGVSVEDKFVIGYGLDYQEYFRNLPGIYVVEDF
jgi:hypoxanthine phosphoribosyltransferase